MSEARKNSQIPFYFWLCSKSYEKQLIKIINIAKVILYFGASLPIHGFFNMFVHFFSKSSLKFCFCSFCIFQLIMSLRCSCFHFSPAVCVFLFSSKPCEYSAWAPRTNDSNFLLTSTFKTPLSLWIPLQTIHCVRSGFLHVVV